MNYVYSDGTAWSPGFSRGRFSGFPINGYRMNEGAGLGTTDPAVLNAFLAGGANRGLVDFATGAIDWNMDGRIDPTPEIRAPAAWHSRGGSDSPLHKANWSLSQGLGPSFPVLTPAAARRAPHNLRARRHAQQPEDRDRNGRSEQV